jgi:RNA polymerase sigma factor (sigma-70 family)
MMKDDAELLRRYADARDEEAFSELVSRNLDFVWATAFRSCRDADFARDISQDVFSDLARKARTLSANKNLVLAGWLYRATRHASAKAMRGQLRRIHREQEASMMEEAFEFPDGTNEEARTILPEIDNAFDQLKSSDRDAVVLRFLKRKSLKEVGDELSISEDAARKRISRSLENCARTSKARVSKPHPVRWR